MAHILILDDARDWRLRLAATLTQQYGHIVRSGAVRGVGRALTELLLTDRHGPDMILVDPFTPGLNAMSLLRMVRIGSSRPVLVISLPLGEAGVGDALRAGADGFLEKPCSPAVVHAHVNAVLRRAAPAARPGTLHVGELRLDVDARTATLRGIALRLTRGEFNLLACLITYHDNVVPRGKLTAHIGGSSLDTLLFRLRAKLGETARHPRYLHTHRGRGVALRTPASCHSRHSSYPV
ncbi:MAG: response regulator transcription factor [Stackebrandtia sp.]